MIPNTATIQKLEIAADALFKASQVAHTELGAEESRAILDLYRLVKEHQAELKAGMYVSAYK